MEPTARPERVVVLDTETTGLSGDARVVEFAALEVDPRTGRTGRRLHHLLDPRVPIPPVVTRIHGISDADVAGKPPFPALAPRIAAFLRGATLAIQNAAFDRRMLDAEFARAGQPALSELGVRIVDTVAVSRAVFPLLDGHSLDRVCDRAGVDRSRRAFHGALVDVELLARALPHLALHYDAIFSQNDDGSCVELERAAGDLEALVAALTSKAEDDRAESLDAAFAAIAVAGCSVRDMHANVWARFAESVPVGGWSSSGCAARWTASQSVSYKTAALAYLDEGDLDRFRVESQTRALLPAACDDASLANRLAHIAAAMENATANASLPVLASASLALGASARTLAGARTGIRERLLLLVDEGYALRHALVRLQCGERTRYKAAVDTLLRGADLAPFTTRRERLSLRVRDFTPCAALFGSPEPQNRTGALRVA